jgi:MFS transporter, DHA1 family, tetracycline resistance protein
VAPVSKIISSAYALLRSLPAPARVGLFLFFVSGLADGVLMPFFALWAQQDAGVATEYIGLLLGCYAGGELLATPFVGGIADRVGRRPVLVISTAGIGFGFLLLYLTRGALVAAGALIVIGMFESVLHPTAAAVITDVVTPATLRKHFSLTRVMSNAGRTVGPAIGALLALRSLGLVFFASAAALLCGTVIVALFLAETRPSSPVSGQDEGDEDEEGLVALSAVFRDRRLAALLAPIAVLEIAASWIEAVTPLYAHNAGTLSASGVGLLFAFAGALAAVFQLPVTQASARWSGFAVILVGGLAQVAAFACLVISPAVPLLIGAMTLLALADMLSGPLSQTVVAELAPARAKATYMAAFSSVSDLKDTVGPAIGTYLFATMSVLPWGTGIVASLLAATALAGRIRSHEVNRDPQYEEMTAADQSVGARPARQAATSGTKAPPDKPTERPTF